jgi:hypothetical protein
VLKENDYQLGENMDMDSTAATIPMLIEAAKLFKNMRDRCLDCAEKVGEKVWQKGITTNGNGLFYGVSGNAYALFSLYRGFR